MSEINKGVTCIECRSVFFSIKPLLEHVRDEHHEWFKSGDGAVIKISLYTPHKETYNDAYAEGYSDGFWEGKEDERKTQKYGTEKRKDKRSKTEKKP